MPQTLGGLPPQWRGQGRGAAGRAGLCLLTRRTAAASDTPQPRTGRGTWGLPWVWELTYSSE